MIYTGPQPLHLLINFLFPHPHLLPAERSLDALQPGPDLRRRRDDVVEAHPKIGAWLERVEAALGGERVVVR